MLTRSIFNNEKRRDYENIKCVYHYYTGPYFGRRYKPGFAHDDEDGHAPVAKGVFTYSADIKPVFEKRCSKCHGYDSPEHAEFEKNEEKYKVMKKGRVWTATLG